MTEVLAARAAYEQAQVDARLLVARAKAQLGLAIHQAREQDTSQTDVMKALELSREQIRGFEAAYRNWPRDHPGQSLTS